MKKLKSEDFVRIQKRLLKISGIWPNRSPTVMKVFWSALNLLISYINFAFLFYGIFVTNDFSQFIQNLNIFMQYFTYNAKLTIFYFKQSKFVSLLDFLQIPIFYSYRDDLEEHLERSIKMSTLVIKAFRFLAFSTALFLYSVPLLRTKHERQLPFDYGVTGVTEKCWFCYVLVYAFQGLALFSAICGTIGLDCIPPSLMGAAAAYFKILRGTIVEAVNSPPASKEKTVTIDDYGKFDEEVNGALKKCIDLHLAIITFVETTEEIFTYIFLLQFSVSAVSLCVAGFVFILTSPKSFEFLMVLSVFGSIMFQISLYCVYGDEVTHQSLQVGEACYMTDWMYCGPKVRKTLFIIMERSKRPSALTAGKFVNLSLSSLVAIFQSAYSYGTVLQQLYKD